MFLCVDVCVCVCRETCYLISHTHTHARARLQYGTLSVVDASEDPDGSAAGQEDRSGVPAMRPRRKQTLSHRLAGLGQQHGIAGLNHTRRRRVPVRRLFAGHRRSVDRWSRRKGDGEEEGNGLEGLNLHEHKVTHDDIITFVEKIITYLKKT